MLEGASSLLQEVEKLPQIKPVEAKCVLVYKDLVHVFKFTSLLTRQISVLSATDYV